MYEITDISFEKKVTNTHPDIISVTGYFSFEEYIAFVLKGSILKLCSLDNKLENEIKLSKENDSDSDVRDIKTIVINNHMYIVCAFVGYLKIVNPLDGDYLYTLELDHKDNYVLLHILKVLLAMSLL